MKAKAESTQSVHNEFKGVFQAFAVLKTLQIKGGAKLYQECPRHLAYAVQMPFNDELD